ncbi:unnamed protein product [Cylindrotheca closterium]|uniref:Actin n=1 Tax=Cylindrotheca closterium TaxID=2856 RepID=A0AAD2JLJ1_9STRA|nr:unnamed protein product [Cylindrotheca closterium]
MSSYHPPKRDSMRNQIRTPALVQNRKRIVKHQEPKAVPPPPSIDEDTVDLGAIVIDNGTGSTKAGFAGEDDPRCVFPTLVAHPTSTFGPNSKAQVGKQAEAKWSVLDVQQPIDRGIIQNWDDMETIWHHTFYQLKASSQHHPVLLTEVPLNPKANRERMTQIMFETFKVPALYINNTAILALYANGRTSGCVLESGEGVSHAVPVCEGYVIPHAILRLPLGGKDLTQLLQNALAERGHALQDHIEKNFSDEGLVLTSTAVQVQVRTMKETLGYVALDFGQETIKAVDKSAALEKSFDLKDGTSIQIGNERFYFPEHLFQPNDLMGLEEEGVADMTFQAIMKCDELLQYDMFSNIVLSGGSTMFPGFRERMLKELTALAGSVEITINDTAGRANAPWVGGSILASLEQFNHLWITKQEYDETGSSIVHTKCY